MSLNPINIGTIIPVEYSHMHDAHMLFRKYRESFDFGLTMHNYYLNENVKDKKSNFNTQYTLTNLLPLSSIIELKIPYTKQANNSFTTTIKQNTSYLKTNWDDLDSELEVYTEFNTLSTEFFFTFTLTSINVGNTLKEERVIISQERLVNNVSTTYYLQAPTTQNLKATWATTAPSIGDQAFRFIIENNTLRLFSSPNNNGVAVGVGSTSVGIGTTAVNTASNVAVIYNNELYWKAPGTWQSQDADLATSYFTINRHQLTKNYKHIPNNFTTYLSSYNTDKVNLNTSTITENISNNYFVYSNNYNFYHSKNFTETQDDNTVSIHADLFPLKNQATLREYYSPNNHYNSEPDYLNRVYEKIHSGTNQQNGLDKINLSYNIGTYDIEFEPSKLTYFTTPNSISPYTVLHIKDSKIHNIGSVAGDNPLLADKVFKRREVIKNNNFNDNIDPTYLCSWLSGNEHGEKQWIDRYYNPTIKSFSDSLSSSDTTFHDVVTSVGAQTTETFDVSSSLTFEPNNDYMLYHVGQKDYEGLFNAYNKYNKTLDIEYLDYKNVPTPADDVLADKEFNFQGNTYAKFTPNIKGDFSLNFWLETKDNTQPFGYLLTGNFFEEGFGIFNTDLVTPNIILPTINPKSKKTSRLLFLNNDFEIYDEIILRDGVTEINIKGIARKDNFSEFYILGEDKVIYVFNSNNNLISKIEAIKNNTSTIDDFEVGEDKIHVLFNPITYTPSAITDLHYYTYDINTNRSSNAKNVTAEDTVGRKGKIVRKNKRTYIYEVDSQNSFGNELAFDSNGQAYTIRQSYPARKDNPSNFAQKNSPSKDDPNNRTNLIKSGLSKRSVINGLLVDDEDNIIVLHDNNIISIMDNDRVLKYTREFCNLNNLRVEQSYLDMIYDFEDGVYKKYILLVQQYNDGFRLTKINDKLKIISTKKYYKEILGPLRFTKTITSYSYLQKTGANKNRFKVVMTAKPKFSATGVVPKEKHVIDFDISTLNAGYNHFFVNVSLRKGFMDLYVNGRKFERKRFEAGRYVLDDVLGSGCYVGAVSTPFYLTFANRLLQPKKYFLKDVKIKGYRMYDKTLSYFDMLAHYNYHLGEKKLIWSYPIGQRTYVDTIDKLFKFTLPERINNKYRLQLSKTGITDNKLKDKIKEKIKEELLKITPYYDEVTDITID